MNSRVNCEKSYKNRANRAKLSISKKCLNIYKENKIYLFSAIKYIIY